MTDVPIPPDRIVDVDGRDPERTPMQWDATANAGFTTGLPWLPIAADAQQVNVAAQRDDPRSMFSFYRRLIALRQGSRALRAGSYRTVASPSGVFAYVREAEGESYGVGLNFTDVPRRVVFARRADVVLSTTDERGGSAERGQFDLAPNEGILARLS